MRAYLTLATIFILIAIAFIFGSQNNQVITLNYMIAKTEITVAAAVSLFTSIGVLLGLLFALLWKLTASFKKRKKLPENLK